MHIEGTFRSGWLVFWKISCLLSFKPKRIKLAKVNLNLRWIALFEKIADLIFSFHTVNATWVCFNWNRVWVLLLSWCISVVPLQIIWLSFLFSWTKVFYSKDYFNVWKGQTYLDYGFLSEFGSMKYLWLAVPCNAHGTLQCIADGFRLCHCFLGILCRNGVLLKNIFTTEAAILFSLDSSLDEGANFALSTNQKGYASEAVFEWSS